MSEFLTPKGVNNILYEFKEGKAETQVLSESYAFLGEHERANRVAECSSHLWFHDNKLHRANFCRDRLCPLCAYRLARKRGAELVHTVKALSELRFVFITFTVPNVVGELLHDLVQTTLKATGTLFDSKFWKNFALGYIRALEVTCELDWTFHPHIHLLVCVSEEDYEQLTRDKTSISAQLLSEWRRAMNDDRIMDIDIHPVGLKGTDEDVDVVSYELAVVRVALYCAKPATCVVVDNPERTINNVKWISEALRGVRLFSDGGILRKQRQELAEQRRKNAIEKVEPPYLAYYRYNPQTTNYENYGYVLNTCSRSYQRTLFMQARVVITPWVRLN